MPVTCSDLSGERTGSVGTSALTSASAVETVGKLWKSGVNPAPAIAVATVSETHEILRACFIDGVPLNGCERSTIGIGYKYISIYV